MPERFKFVEISFEEHNKAYWEIQKEKELILRNGCTCEYYKLVSFNLKTLQNIYSHSKKCPCYEKGRENSNS